AQVSADEAADFQPRLVYVDGSNQIQRIGHQIPSS
ncbi:MAG: aspartate 1-decarboxylase, partial [Acidithiobacillus ferrivorans]